MNNFDEHLKEYLSMPKNDRVWLGGIYNLTKYGQKYYSTQSNLFQLQGMSDTFHMEPIEKTFMLEINAENNNELNKLFELNIEETQKDYENNE